MNKQVEWKNMRIFFILYMQNNRARRKAYRLYLVSPFHFFAVLSGIIRGLLLLVIIKSFPYLQFFRVFFFFQEYRIFVNFSLEKVSDRSKIYFSLCLLCQSRFSHLVCSVWKLWELQDWDLSDSLFKSYCHHYFPL